MMTRSIAGRFLILAVLLVSLGVIAQAALIITRGSGKAVAKASAVPAAAPSTAVAALTPAPVSAPSTAVAAPTVAPAAGPAAAPPAAVQASPAAQPAPSGGDASPIRVVYPGPLGDTGAPPRKFVAAAPAMPAPAAPQPAAPDAAAPPAPAAPAPAKPAPVVVASADAGTQPTADAAPAGKGGINLNSASIDALNHLGGGHIGQTIVQHRPYHSVEDLVKKRVVRRSVYEQIKNQVAAD